MSVAHPWRWALAVALLLFALTLSLPVASAAWPPDERATAAETVAALRGEVRRVAVEHPDPVRRAWAWRALALVRDSAIAEAYDVGLSDPHAAVRREAVRAMRRLNEPLISAAPTTSTQPSLLQQATPAGAAARAAVIGMLADPDPQVRLVAAQVVAASPDDRGWKHAGLAAGLRDPRAAVWLPCLTKLVDATLAESSETAPDLPDANGVKAAADSDVLLQALDAAIRSGEPARQWAALDAAALHDLPREKRAPLVEPAIGSPNGEVAWYAIRLSSENVVADWQKVLRGPPGPARKSLTRNGWSDGALGNAKVGRELVTLASEAFAAGEPGPFTAAVDAARYEWVRLKLNHDALRAWALSDDPVKVDAGAAGLLLLGRQGKYLAPESAALTGLFNWADPETAKVWNTAVDGGEEREIAAVEKLLKRFTNRPLGSPERRDAAEQLAEWLRATFGVPRVLRRGSVSVDRRDMKEYGVRWPEGELAERVGPVLTAATDDGDPWVRRSACQAIVATLAADRFGTSGVSLSRDGYWRSLFACANDEHPAVRRVVAMGLAWFGQAFSPDDTDAESPALAAAERLNRDPDPETARLARTFYVGRSSAPGAAAALRSLLDATPRERALASGLDPTEWEEIAGAALWSDALGADLETLLALARGDETLPGDHLSVAAVARLLKQRDPVWRERLLREVERDPSRWEEGVFEAALAWGDPVRGPNFDSRGLKFEGTYQVIDALNRINQRDPTQGELMTRLIEELAQNAGDFAAETLAAWLREARNRPGVRYAMTAAPLRLDDPTRLAALGTDDPLACCLAYGALIQSPALGIEDAGSVGNLLPRQRRLLESAVSIREQ